MKKIGIITLLLVITSLFVIQYVRAEKEPIYCKYADEVTNAFRFSVKKQYGLTATAEGGSFMDNVKLIYLSFDTYNKRYDIAQARELMVNCAEDYLERINKDEKVRPFLDHFPFAEEGLEFSINFYEKRFEKVEDVYIAGIHLVNSTLFYSVFSKEKDVYISIFKEPYQEALRIVREGKVLDDPLKKEERISQVKLPESDSNPKDKREVMSPENLKRVHEVNRDLREKYNLD